MKCNSHEKPSKAHLPLPPSFVKINNCESFCMCLLAMYVSMLKKVKALLGQYSENKIFTPRVDRAVHCPALQLSYLDDTVLHSNRSRKLGQELHFCHTIFFSVYCTALHYSALLYSALRYALLHFNALHYKWLRCTAPQCTALESTALDYAAQY